MSEAWDTISAPFGQSVRDYYVAQGRTTDAPEVVSSVRTNTELVPQRAEALVRALKDLDGVDELAGTRIVDLGSGWGSLAAYLASIHHPTEVVAVDSRQDFVDAADKAIHAAGLESVMHFVTGDITELDLPADVFDVAIANNVLVYLVTSQQLRVALAETLRMLKPGGVLICHQANKLTLRDPFSHAPLVHLMPGWMAGAVCKVTGWRHNHGRVRLVSPRALRREFKRAGFTDVKIGAPSSGRTITGRSARAARFFIVTGRKP